MVVPLFTQFCVAYLWWRDALQMVQLCRVVVREKRPAHAALAVFRSTAFTESFPPPGKFLLAPLHRLYDGLFSSILSLGLPLPAKLYEHYFWLATLLLPTSHVMRMLNVGVLRLTPELALAVLQSPALPHYRANAEIQYSLLSTLPYRNALSLMRMLNHPELQRLVAEVDLMSLPDYFQACSLNERGQGEDENEGGERCVLKGASDMVDTRALYNLDHVDIDGVRSGLWDSKSCGFADDGGEARSGDEHKETDVDLGRGVHQVGEPLVPDYLRATYRAMWKTMKARGASPTLLAQVELLARPAQPSVLCKLSALSTFDSPILFK